MKAGEDLHINAFCGGDTFLFGLGGGDREKSGHLRKKSQILPETRGRLMVACNADSEIKKRGIFT